MTDNPGILEEVEGQPGVYRAIGLGCATVEMRCEAGCCICQACQICVGPPQCPAIVGFVDFADGHYGPMPIDRLSRLVVRAAGEPALPHEFFAPEGWVYDWAVHLSSDCGDCPFPGSCEHCPDGCALGYTVTTRWGELRLWQYEEFATLNPQDGQCLWIGVRYRPADCTPNSCCDDPYIRNCCMAEASCKIRLYARDFGLDTDGDGYCDWEEEAAGSDPNQGDPNVPGALPALPPGRLIDDDRDMLSRVQDIPTVRGYDPFTGLPLPGPELFDTDGDGVQDLAELDLGLNPETRYSVPDQVDRYSSAYLEADLDEDLAYDVFERSLGLDPSVRDSDGDGIVDGIELRSRLINGRTGTDPTVNHRRESGDTDGDGLSDFEEVTFYGTNPGREGDPAANYLARDTDRDGLTDYFEVRAGLNPRTPYSEARTILVAQGFPPVLREVLGPHDSAGDTDFDGLNNILEQILGTDPTLRDTDGDGVTDGQEFQQGSSPTDPTDGGGESGEGGEQNVCWMMVTINGGHHPSGCNDDYDGDGVGGDDPPHPGTPGFGVGGMTDWKLPNFWTVTITVGDLNGDGDTDDPGERIDISTGPNGERTTLLIPFRRGRCYDISMSGYRRRGYFHDAWFLQIVPVDPETVNNPRPTICTTCCCMVLDDPDGTVGNGCFEDPSTHRPARLCLPLVDIDVDSDNDQGTSAPSRTAVEERMEEESAIGKLLAIHNIDDDGDFVPDFADGYNLDGLVGTADDLIDSPGAATVLTPVLVEIGGIPEPANARVRFQYPASDPAAVVITPDSGGGSPTYDLPASGKLRLWRKPADQERVIHASGGSSSPAGDYIVPGHLYTLEDLGIPEGGTLQLWAEAVGSSASLKDITIAAEVVGLCEPDTIAFTGIGTQYRVVTEINGQLQLGAAVPFPPLSAPSPVITVNSKMVSNVRAAADLKSIRVDISVSGVLDDTVTDLMRDSTIERLDVYLNDQPIPADTVFPGYIPVSTVQKLGLGDPDFVPTSVLRPFDYTGSFSAALTDVEVGPGWNTLKLVATNARGFSGYAEFAFEVITEAPPDQVLEIGFDFHGVAPTEEVVGPPPVLTMAVVSNGVNFGSVDLERVAPGRYEFQTLVVEVIDAEAAVLDPTQPDVWLLRVTYGDVTLYESMMLVQETGDATGIFLFGGELTESERTSLAGWTIALGAIEEVQSSRGGIFIPTVAELVGPIALGNADSLAATLRTSAGDIITYEVVAFGGHLLYAESEESPPAVFIATLAWSPERDRGDDGGVPDRPRCSSGTTRCALIGFKDGICAAGVEWWQGSVDLAASAIEQSIYWGWWVRWVYGDETAELLDQKNRQQITEVVANVQQIAEFAPVVYDIVLSLLAGDEVVINAIFRGDHSGLNGLEEKHRVAIEIAAMLIVQLRTEVANMDAYDVGWLAGRIIGEVGIQVSQAALSGGLSSVQASTTLVNASARLTNVLSRAPRFAAAAQKIATVGAAATGALRIAFRFGKRCERMTENRLRLQRDLGLDEWRAFQRVIDDYRLSPRRTKKDATSLLGATHLTFKDLYERLTAGPDIDLTQFPTYNQFRQVMHGLLAEADIEGHHIAVKELMKKIGRLHLGRDLNANELAELDNMPVFPLWKHWHRPTGAFVDPPKNFHDILEEVLARRPPRTIQAFRERLQEAYRQFNLAHGQSAAFDYELVGRVADAYIGAWLSSH